MNSQLGFDLHAATAFISYVNGFYDDEVASLAHQLNALGVPCDYDGFNLRPVAGWPRWMDESIARADFVLMICTEAYNKRCRLLEQPGVGKGASFEAGLLAQRVLDAQGSDHRIIPIIFDSADREWIPSLVKDQTYFLLPSRFDSLYRVLTDQPARIKPPLGQIKKMPPADWTPNIGSVENAKPDVTMTAVPGSVMPAQSPLAIFRLRNGDMIFARYEEFSRQGKDLSMTLLVESDENAASIAKLRRERQRLLVGWGVDAVPASIRNYREKHTNDKRFVEVTFVEEERGFGSNPEVTFNGITPDQIALRRARRILLNERPAVSELGAFGSDQMNEKMLESYVSGLGSNNEFRIVASPIPPVMNTSEPLSERLEVARLMCAFLLISTHAVERIIKLNIEFNEKGVSVEFVGMRARQYSNDKPVTLTVSGVCPFN